METTNPDVLSVDRDNFDPSDLKPAATLIREGGLVAFPTETVYGLGANALDEDAVQHIFEVKGRPPSNPIIVHVSNVSQAKTMVSEWPEEAQRLADRFWPGPLTIVLPKAEGVADVVTAGLPTVALRMPSHPVALELIRQAGVPVAAPSANRYTGVSATTAKHVVRNLGDVVDLVVDGGPTEVGIESTVVTLAHDPPKILRPGMISWEVIAETIPTIMPLEEHSYVEDDEEPRPSPGLGERHYAPDATVIISKPRTRKIVNTKRLGMLVFEGGPPILDGLVVEVPCEPREYARRLYDALHRFDEAGCEIVLIEPPPKKPTWEAIWDRLQRAAVES